jgi:photosystem II stability/assembly factor-like uncharacterized protein
MRKYFIPGFLLLFYTGLNAQIQWLNPKPTGHANNRVKFVSDNTGYLINSNGDFFKTVDAGNSWSRVKSYTNAQTFRLDYTTGVITGMDSSIYISSDNGTTYIKMKQFPGLLDHWSDIVSRDTIFIVRSTSNFTHSLHKSTDRGLTWQMVNSQLDQFKIASLDFVNSSVGLVARADGIYKTNNGGVDWANVYPTFTSQNITTVKLFDTQFGLAFREGIGVLRTTNGGGSWNLIPGTDQFEFGEFFFVNENTVFAIGERLAYKSTNGGISWNAIGPGGLGNNFHSAYFINANSGIIVGDRGEITRTSNSGNTWLSYSPFWRDVAESDFGSHDTGFAVTRNAVYRTADGGQSWNELPLSPNPPLNGYFDHCDFFSRDTGFVTAAEPVRFYKTTNAGQTWTLVYPMPAASNHYKITGHSFINKDTGYIVTNIGVAKGLFKTYNGGLTWSEIGSSQDFTLIQFLSDQVGYATKYDKVFRTLDGGSTWLERPTYDFIELTAMHFISPAKGFVGSNQGNLKMTSDSGRTWTQIPVASNFSAYIARIKFIGPDMGYLTDLTGRYFKSADGGLQWKEFGRTANNGINSINFRVDSTAILSGLYGTVSSNPVSECKIESVDVGNSGCGNMFKAKISVFPDRADSIYFEYGKNNFTDRILATPNSVTNGTLNIFQPATLTGDSVYKMRVRCSYRGSYIYSDEIYFIARTAVPAPVVTANGNVLSSSSATGNQWYFNGVLIPGATNQQFTANNPGIYTVIVTQNNCSSSVSNGVTITITALPDINPLSKEVFIYPNPVFSDQFFIDVKGNKNFVFRLLKLDGGIVSTYDLKPGLNDLRIPFLGKGNYIAEVIDSRTFQSISFKLVKL